MRNSIVAVAAIAVFAAGSIVPVAAQEATTPAYIAEQLAKAEKRVASAEKNLLKWQDCAANAETCMAELREKAAAAADRAQKKLAAMSAE